MLFLFERELELSEETHQIAWMIILPSHICNDQVEKREISKILCFFCEIWRIMVKFSPFC